MTTAKTRYLSLTDQHLTTTFLRVEGEVSILKQPGTPERWTVDIQHRPFETEHFTDLVAVYWSDGRFHYSQGDRRIGGGQ